MTPVNCHVLHERTAGTGHGTHQQTSGEEEEGEGEQSGEAGKGEGEVEEAEKKRGRVEEQAASCTKGCVCLDLSFRYSTCCRDTS